MREHKRTRGLIALAAQKSVSGLRQMYSIAQPRAPGGALFLSGLNAGDVYPDKLLLV